MVSTLVVGTNTYVTNAEADTYLEDSITGGPWAFLDEETQDRSLISAFRILAKQPWAGSKTDPDQLADFPRTGIECNGETVDSALVPEDIKSAQIELALLLGQDPTLANSSNTGSNTKRLQAGSASVEYFNSTDGSGGTQASRFPPQIQELLNCYLGSGSSASAAEAFGTGCESIKPCCTNDGFDRNLPL
jgi:hypothetical protein